MSAQDDVFAELKLDAQRKIVGLYRRAWSHEAPDLASWIRAEPNRSAGVAAALVRADAEERAERNLPRDRVVYEASLGELAGDAEVARVLDGLGAMPARRDRASAASEGSLGSIVREGAKLRDFRLIQRLGAGRFGEVWHARDVSLECDVALKLMVGSSDRAQRLDALRREASAASGIHHPNVVNVRGAGEIPELNLVYIAMELCADHEGGGRDSDRVRIGAPLDVCRERMTREGALYARIATELMVGICRGVHEAHRHGVVHRDLKPANVLVTPSGRAMVTDFGLASTGLQADPGDGAFDAERSICLDLGEGRVVGTPAYMPPEQARGERATPRSDVYALGGTLYFLLCGRSPHEPAIRAATRGDRDAIVAMIARGEIEIPPLPPRVPGVLRRICERALRSTPADRYETAVAMAEDLEAALVQRVPPIAGSGYAGEGVVLLARRRPGTALAIPIAALCVLGGAALYVSDLTAAGNAERQARQHAEKFQYTASIGAADAALRLGRTGDARRYLEAAPSDERGLEWQLLHRRLEDSTLTLGGTMESWSPSPCPRTGR